MPKWMSVWRTSCPCLSVWEEANRRAFIVRMHDGAGEARVRLSDSGRAKPARGLQRL
jgi:hypothetical protein